MEYGFNPFSGFSSSETRSNPHRRGDKSRFNPFSGFSSSETGDTVASSPAVIVSIPSLGFLVLRRLRAFLLAWLSSSFNPFSGFSSSETVVLRFGI